MELVYAFNGDADGLCAAHQLRLRDPRPAALVTGPKRDTRLLDRIPTTEGLEIVALDVSLKANLASLERLLDGGAECKFFDHHDYDELPSHPRLRLFLDTTPSINTSWLVDRYLEGAHRLWAVVGLFGDNMAETARSLAGDINETELSELRLLGKLLNYNAYGARLADLHFDPAALLVAMTPFSDPRVFARETEFVLKLQSARERDLQAAARVPKLRENVVCLPNEPWARRVHGEFANEWVLREPNAPLAVLVQNDDETWLVSVRVPRDGSGDAASLCRGFPGGGGRRWAAGIPALSEEHLPRFLEAFSNYQSIF